MSVASTSAPEAQPDLDASAPGDGRPPRPARQFQPRPASPGELVRLTAGTFVIILSVCLLGFAVWLAFGSRWYYDRAQFDTYESFRASLAQATAPTGPTNPANAKQLLGEGQPVAVLKIPEIGLNAVVFQGTTSQILESGPGHVRDSPMPGQPGASVIYGRRAAYGAPFAGLGSLAPDEEFTVTTGQGVATYEVLDIRRAGDPAPPALAAGQGRLVLATADGAPFDPSGVLWVDASLVSTPFQAPTMILTPGDLSPTEQPLATEPLAWVPVVLWGQALLILSGVIGYLWQSWGKWQAWIIAVPVLCYLGINVANEIARLLPNLM
ncbi:MAG TPA: sortase [Trebonia sp.]|nr:sortase [Trebonia sp.]